MQLLQQTAVVYKMLEGSESPNSIDEAVLAPLRKCTQELQNTAHTVRHSLEEMHERSDLELPRVQDLSAEPCCPGEHTALPTQSMFRQMHPRHSL